MRLLFSGVPAFGHLLPFAPLAAAAQRAGHDVGILTSAGMTELIAQDLPGAEVISAGPMPGEIFAEVARRFEGSNPALDPKPETVADFFAGSRVDLSVDQAIGAASGWRPDLIIAEATDFVGPMVAAALDISWNLLALGPSIPDEFVAPMRALAHERYVQRELEPRHPVNYIDPSPLSLQPDGWIPIANRIGVRAQAHERAGAGHFAMPVSSNPQRRRVLVTLGTVFSNESVIREIIGSIDRSEWDIIATTEPLAGECRDTERSDMTSVGFVPLAELLDVVEAVVNTGGAGTVLGTMSRGLPMVIFPQGADQFINADRAAASGVAIVVDDPSKVGGALQTITTNSRYGAAATRIAQEIAASLSPADVIEELVRQQLEGAATPVLVARGVSD